jgi:hypothetical protein
MLWATLLNPRNCCQATVKHLDPGIWCISGCNVHAIARSMLFAANLSSLTSISSNESEVLRTISQLGLRIFSQAHGINNACPRYTKDSARSRLRARSLLCVRQHRRRKRSSRPSRVCKWSAALSDRIRVNQPEERTTI